MYACAIRRRGLNASHLRRQWRADWFDVIFETDGKIFTDINETCLQECKAWWLVILDRKGIQRDQKKWMIVIITSESVLFDQIENQSIE